MDALQKAKTGERRFTYSNFGGYEMAFCGYAGYWNATIPAVDDSFAKNLDVTYRRVRESQPRELNERTVDGKTKLIETNGLRVLFYAADFEFPRHALGLRYNENWVEECVRFGHQREHIRLCPLISDADAVERSWRDGPIVPGLNVKPHQPLPATEEEPIVVRGPVKAFVIGDHTLKQLFQPKRDDYLSIYVVESNRIVVLEHNDGKWQPRDFE